MLFRVQVVLAGETLAVIGTLIRPYWGMLLLILCTFVRPQDDRPNIQPLHIEEALTIAMLVATALRPAEFLPRLSFAFRKLRWMFVLVGLMCISALANGWTEASSSTVQDIVTTLIVCMLILIWIRTQEHVMAVAWLLITAGMYYFKETVQSPTYFRDDDVQRLNFRGNTNFGNPNFLALLMVVVIFLALSLLSSARHFWTKLALLGVTGGCFFVFLKCQSRGATLAMVAAALIFCLMQRRKLVAFVALATALGLGLTFFAPKTYVKRLKTIAHYQEDGSALTRLEMWERSLQIMGSDPLLGIGPDNFNDLMRSRRYPNGMTQHEAYLQVATEAGLPAGLIYVGLLLGGIYAAWVARRLASPARNNLPYLHKLAEGLICSIVAITIAGFFTGLAFREIVYMTLTLAYCARQAAEEATEEEPQEAPLELPAAYVEG